MKVLESTLRESIQKTYTLKQGTVFAFENFIITEFSEGSTVDEECFLQLYQILDIFGQGKINYGLISNRVNSYAVNTSDLLPLMEVANKKYACAMVVYSDMNAKSAAFEIEIYKCGSPTFTDLEKAICWISDQELAIC